MELLYLSHCVPNAPDKGEKIRAYYVLQDLVRRYRVHLVCFARTDEEVAAARGMSDCASVYVEKISHKTALAKAFLGFAAGSCLNTSYFSSAAMRKHVKRLVHSVKLDAAIAYTTVMAPYAPPEMPVLLDMSDVDSEKWFQYAQMRRPSLPFAIEAKRLRKEEILYANTAKRTIVMTHQECELLKSFAPAADVTYVSNGVDFARFDPATIRPKQELQGRKFLAFVGFLDYYPNVDAAIWFADHVFGELRNRVPDLELAIIGKNPVPALKALGSRPGIWLEPSPEDVRPYLAASAAIITPLRLARGIQNKVLEGLAMGKRVFASTAICNTLGASLPRGVIHCRSPRDFVDSIAATSLQPAACDLLIRDAAQEHFSWSQSLERIGSEVAALTGLHEYRDCQSLGRPR